MSAEVITQKPTVQQALARRVAQYVAVRDRLREMDDEHKKRRAALVEIQDQLSGMLMAWLEQSGAESVKTHEGTFFSSTKTTASLNDADAFMKYVVVHGAYALLDRRANATAVRDYAKTNGELPPGVTLTTARTLNVRRPGKTKDEDE